MLYLILFSASNVVVSPNVDFCRGWVASNTKMIGQLDLSPGGRASVVSTVNLGI